MFRINARGGLGWPMSDISLSPFISRVLILRVGVRVRVWFGKGCGWL